MNHLPNDLVREILIRLPIKSLLQCRFVCRTWWILIEEPCFADLHLTRSKQNHPYNTPISFLENPSSRITSFCLLNLDPAIDDIDAFEFQGRRSVFGISFCNGLLCTLHNNSIVLGVYNPMTKQCLSLPKLPFQLDIVPITCSCFGIGFHAATNEYKVVWITDHRQHHHEAVIWTLGCSTSWRCIGKIPYSLDDIGGKGGLFVQGALHWLWLMDNSQAILSMDMGSEKFCKIELSFASSHMSHMREWNGRLAMVEYGFENPNCSCKIWVLNENEGNTMSWRKEVSFEWKWNNTYPNSKFDWDCRRYDPLCVQKNGEILVRDKVDEMLVSYNIENRSFMRVKSCPNPPGGAGVSMSYVRSLVRW